MMYLASESPAVSELGHEETKIRVKPRGSRGATTPLQWVNVDRSVAAGQGDMDRQRHARAQSVAEAAVGTAISQGARPLCQKRGLIEAEVTGVRGGREATTRARDGGESPLPSAYQTGSEGVRSLTTNAV